MKITRDSEGNIFHDGNFIAKCSINESMLNTLINVQSFGEDHSREDWVYLNNLPIRKKFIQINGINVWKPNFELKSLHERYIKIKKKRDSFINDELIPLENLIKDCKIAYAIKSDAEDLCYKFTYTNLGILIDITQIPEKLENIEIGNRYSQSHTRLMNIGSRLYKFKKVLEECILQKLEGVQAEHGQQVCLVLDEMYYFYQKTGNFWEIISWPAQQLKVIWV